MILELRSPFSPIQHIVTLAILVFFFFVVYQNNDRISDHFNDVKERIALRKVRFLAESPNDPFVPVNHHGDFNFSVHPDSYVWLPRSAVRFAIREFRKLDKNLTAYYEKTDLKTPRYSSAPFITGDGFRAHLWPNRCAADLQNRIPQIGNNCDPKEWKIYDGMGVFVDGPALIYFVNHIMPNLHARVRIFTDKAHDQGNPDGQDDRALKSEKYELRPQLQKYFDSGKLLSLHASNLHWKRNKQPNVHKPEWAHCVPIGFQDRLNNVSGTAELEEYIRALERNIINRKHRQAGRPLLLFSDTMGRRDTIRPERALAYRAVTRNGFQPPIRGKIPHDKWLDAISIAKFTLAPAGHGLDTHRMAEIYMMGGIPVIVKNTITSCWDDSDNVIGNLTRGSIPVVVVNRWEDITTALLNRKWEEFKKVPPHRWDWHRLFLPHWLERFDFPSENHLDPKNFTRFINGSPSKFTVLNGLHHHELENSEHKHQHQETSFLSRSPAVATNSTIVDLPAEHGISFQPNFIEQPDKIIHDGFDPLSHFQNGSHNGIKHKTQTS